MENKAETTASIVKLGTAVSGGPIEKDAHLWARHPEDWYVEPEWCSRRLFEVEEFTDFVVDPACGLGRIVSAARAARIPALGFDVVDRSEFCFGTGSFLLSSELRPNFVSNPPFGIADKFAAHALSLAARKVALLLPTKWMNSASRGRWLETTPLRRVWLLAPRPSMPPGPVIEAGEKPGNGTVDFAWFVWEQGYNGTPELRWLRRDPEVSPLPIFNAGRG